MLSKLSTILLTVATAALLGATAPSAFGHLGAEAKPRYPGLELATTGPCKGLYRLESSPELCTHGPDPVPAEPTAPAKGAAASAEFTGRVQCDGDGVGGKRVQVIYARPSNVADRFDSLVSDLRLFASDADRIYRMSAAETLGERHVRFVHSSGCVVSVANVRLGVAAVNGKVNFDDVVGSLKNQGFNRSDRKYMVFVDANANTPSPACGLGTLVADDRAAASNKSNFGPTFGMTFIATAGCNGQTAAHELMHNLGAVQNSAPHSTGMGHCTDENDRMCTSADGVPVTTACSDPGHEQMFDCHHDDYFHTNPPVGNYLASHWNTALNQFLVQDRQFLHGWVRTSDAAVTSAPTDQQNSTGAVNTVIRTGRGAYFVTFPGLGAPGSSVEKGTVNVTASGSGSAKCNAATWGPALADLILHVRCFDAIGVPADSTFLASFTRPVGNVGRFAYVWANKPTEASYIPDAFRQYNGLGPPRTNTIDRVGTGVYAVRLPGLASSSGTVKVTAYGFTGNSCGVAAWGPSGADEIVRVACESSSGAAVDAPFTMTFADGMNILGIAGGKGAYLWAEQQTSPSYTPSTDYQWSSAGGVNTITRSGVGSYTVRLPWLPFAGHAQVTAAGGRPVHGVFPPINRTCNVAQLRFAFFDRLVDVRCFDLSGGPADSRFTLGFVA